MNPNYSQLVYMYTLALLLVVLLYKPLRYRVYLLTLYCGTKIWCVAAYIKMYTYFFLALIEVYKLKWELHRKFKCYRDFIKLLNYLDKEGFFSES